MKTLRNLSLYADKIVNSALSEYRRNKVSKDDVLDGLQQQSPQKLGKDTGLNTRPVSPKKMLKGWISRWFIVSRNQMPGSGQNENKNLRLRLQKLIFIQGFGCFHTVAKKFLSPAWGFLSGTQDYLIPQFSVYFIKFECKGPVRYNQRRNYCRLPWYEKSWVSGSVEFLCFFPVIEEQALCNIHCHAECNLNSLFR